MKFIKRFLLFLEGISNNKSINGWVIKYNHNKSHDLDDKLSKRTNVKTEKEFIYILEKVTLKCDSDKLSGSYTFVSFKNLIKLIIDIDNIKGEILIITILGKDEKSRNGDKMIII